MNVPQLLRRARALVNYGWQKGSYYNQADCKFCLAGALAAATHGVTASRFKRGAIMPALPSFEVPKELVKPLGFRTASSLIRWNDRRKRTKEEVLGRLDSAIKVEVRAAKKKKK